MPMLNNRVALLSNRCIIRSKLPIISHISLPSNSHCITKRNFKTGLGEEWTKEERSGVDFKWQQRGQPMDFDNPLTWIGLIAPMFAFGFSFYWIWRIYIEREEEEEEKERQIIREIVKRDPKLKIEDL